MYDVRGEIGDWKNGQNYAVLFWKKRTECVSIWECQLKPALIDHTMRELELLLNDNLLSLYKHHNPIPYGTEEDAPLPMAAESNQP